MVLCETLKHTTIRQQKERFFMHENVWPLKCVCLKFCWNTWHYLQMRTTEDTRRTEYSNLSEKMVNLGVVFTICKDTLLVEILPAHHCLKLWNTFYSLAWIITTIYVNKFHLLLGNGKLCHFFPVCRIICIKRGCDDTNKRYGPVIQPFVGGR